MNNVEKVGSLSSPYYVWKVVVEQLYTTVIIRVISK